MVIYHNPRCTKSRETLAILHDKGLAPRIIEYLEVPPTKEELATILKMLGMPAEKLIRRGEAIFKEKYKGKDLSETEWIQAMIQNPKLIERPIVVSGNKAVIGRPPDRVLEIL